MAATTNAEVHVADGRRLHGERPLHGGEELHGGRVALNDESVEGSAVRWMAPCLLGGGIVVVASRRLFFATRLSELAPIPEDAAPNSIASPAA